MMVLTEKAAAEWEAYVLRAYPNEACAYVVDGKLIPVANLSETPTTTFVVDVVDRLKAEKLGEVQAFLHSHPYKLEESKQDDFPSWASTSDMRSWIADSIVWGIVATDGEGLSPMVWYDDSIGAIQPFEGREFVSGKTDCYSLVRDYYRVKLGINLVNGARGMYWWDNGEDLYENNFKRAGFYEVALDEIRENDVLLIRFQGSVITHAAVLTGTNEIIHHCIRRLSGYDTLSKWSRQVAKAIRHERLRDA